MQQARGRRVAVRLLGVVRLHAVEAVTQSLIAAIELLEQFHPPRRHRLRLRRGRVHPRLHRLSHLGEQLGPAFLRLGDGILAEVFPPFGQVGQLLIGEVPPHRVIHRHHLLNQFQEVLDRCGRRLCR